jgi:hypothetical protein
MLLSNLEIGEHLTQIQTRQQTFRLKYTNIPFSYEFEVSILLSIT